MSKGSDVRGKISEKKKNPGDERCEGVVFIDRYFEGRDQNHSLGGEGRTQATKSQPWKSSSSLLLLFAVTLFHVARKVINISLFKKLLKTFIRYFRKDKNGIGAGSIEFRISRQKCMFLSRELSSPISTRSCHACTQIEGPFLLWAFPAFPNFFWGGAAAQDMH